jgi:hypothetical protein
MREVRGQGEGAGGGHCGGLLTHSSYTTQRDTTTYSEISRCCPDATAVGAARECMVISVDSGSIAARPHETGSRYRPAAGTARASITGYQKQKSVSQSRLLSSGRSCRGKKLSRSRLFGGHVGIGRSTRHRTH